MVLPTKTKCWLMARAPTGLPTYSGENPTFVLETRDLPEVKTGQILVEALYLSNDPSQRTWMSALLPEKRHYVNLIESGSVMSARGLVKVLKSASPLFQEGQLGYGPVGWSEYNVLNAETVKPITPLPNGLDMTHHIGTLGLTGMTAYYGLIDIVGARKGETIVISGAAGATGSMAVRIARHLVQAGRVVGIAGTDEKCRWVEKIGADTCLNYKSSTFYADLAEATKDGLIDVYFDNVGGEMLDKMLGYMAMHGRVALCGAISSYNAGDSGGRAMLFTNYAQMITMRLTLRGFVIHDVANNEAKREEFTRAILDSKILSSMTDAAADSQDTIVVGSVEDIPKIWLRLFEGANRGKLITKLDK